METVGQFKKILFIVTQGNFGGAQKYVFDLSISLNAEGYDITVAAGKSGQEMEKRLAKENINFVRINNLVRQINPIYDIAGFFEILRLLKKLKPDIVHLNSSKSAIIGAVAAKLAGVPKVVFTVHGLVLKEPLSKIKWWMYYILHKFAGIFTDDFITVSKPDAEECIRLGLKDRRRVTIIPISIDPLSYKFIERAEARKNLENYAKTSLDDNILIGTIADFYPSKGLRYLIEAAKTVIEKNLKVKFLFIGRDGPLKEKIPALIKEKGLSGIVMPLAIEDAWQQLRGLDMFVLPSVKEGLPYTILEAMAAGLPIVATTVGGIPDALTDKVSGLLVPPASPQKLADAINEILDNPELAKKLGDQAKIEVQKFNLDKMIEETRKVYENSL